jgi:hypothetical protein
VNDIGSWPWASDLKHSAKATRVSINTRTSALNALALKEWLRAWPMCAMCQSSLPATFNVVISVSVRITRAAAKMTSLFGVVQLCSRQTAVALSRNTASRHWQRSDPGTRPIC